MTTSNSWIRDLPSPEDWLNLEVTDTLTPADEIVNKPPWKHNNFDVYAVGTTPDGKHRLGIRSGIFAAPKKAGRLYINLDGRELELRFNEPVKVSHDPYTLLFTDPTAETKARYAYDPLNRRWYYEVESSHVSLKATFQARGIPFWIAKTVDQAQAHGLAAPFYTGKPVNPTLLDYWGGFVDMSVMQATLETPIGSGTFLGYGGMDREWHLYGAIGNYDAYFCSQRNLDLVIYQSWNPITGERYAHSGRINILNPETQQLIYDTTFDDFEFIDTDYPRRVHIKGGFEGGEVDITGTTLLKNLRKDTIGQYDHYAGNTWIHWTGQITSNTQKINVDAIGVSEMQRLTKPPPWKKLAAVTLLLAAGATLTYLTLKK